MLQQVIIGLHDTGLSQRIASAIQSEEVDTRTVSVKGLKWREPLMELVDLVVLCESVIPSTLKKDLGRLGRDIHSPYLVVVVDEEDPVVRAELLAAGCEAVMSTEAPVESIAEALQALLRKRAMVSRALLIRDDDSWEPRLSDFCTRSQTMKRFMKSIHRVIDPDVPLLVLGETGVGKEWLTRAIHNAGPRADGPFIAVNCGALSETLLESELFGHERGAFTGAHAARRGFFEQAHGGAIFLDEVGEMPPAMQVKLLRVLQDGVVQRVGGERSLKVDVRVFAATNRDLKSEIGQGTFREDLYYRLSVMALEVPPLRERVEDIPVLAESHVVRYAQKFGRNLEALSGETVEALCVYEWPGNVRELSNVIERAVLLCDENRLSLADLPFSVRAADVDAPALAPEQDNTDTTPRWPDGLCRLPLRDARKQVVRAFEQHYFSTLLEATSGRVGETAKLAGMGRRSLYDRLQELGLDKKNYRR